MNSFTDTIRTEWTVGKIASSAERFSRFGDMEVAEDGNLDVAVDIYKVAWTAVLGGGVIDGPEVERRRQLFFAAGGGDNDVQFVIRGDGGFELVLNLDLAALGHVLQIVHSPGGDARGCKSAQKEARQCNIFVYIILWKK